MNNTIDPTHFAATINTITQLRLTVTLTPTRDPLRFVATCVAQDETFKVDVWAEPWCYEMGRAAGFELLRVYQARGKSGNG